jgi:hypothetical protein
MLELVKRGQKHVEHLWRLSRSLPGWLFIDDEGTRRYLKHFLKLSETAGCKIPLTDAVDFLHY